MTYCRKCGALLDENARFCRVCGTPVETVAAPQAAPPPYRYRARRPWILPVAILSAVLLVVLIASAFTFAPLQSVNFSKDYNVPDVSGVNNIKVIFDSDVANVNVIPSIVPNSFVRLHVSATGSIGLLGNADQPVKVTLGTQIVGNVGTVTAHLTRTTMFPFTDGLKVTCDLYVDSRLILDLDVRTSVGSVIMNPNVEAVFQGLSLQSTTGRVEASLPNSVTLPSAISFSTTTGSVAVTWTNAQVTGNTAVSLSTTTGSVEFSVAQHKNLAGSVTINAQTTTGSVNPTINISGNVGAQITSQTSFGSVSTSVQNFNGNKSPIYSINYPATNNLLINAQTTTGSVNIKAVYTP